MEKKDIILIAIGILVIALIIVGAAIYMGDNAQAEVKEVVNNTTNKTVANISTDKENTTANTTVVGDNSTRVNETNTTNQTFKVYNPQSDSYVEVIGEKYDADVNRWYTYDTDGVRYYNTRIN